MLVSLSFIFDEQRAMIFLPVQAGERALDSLVKLLVGSHPGCRVLHHRCGVSQLLPVDRDAGAEAVALPLEGDVMSLL